MKAVSQTWSAAQWAEISAKAAELVAKEAMEAAGGALELVVSDFAAVRTITGLSRHTIRRWLTAPDGTEPRYRRAPADTKLLIRPDKVSMRHI